MLVQIFREKKIPQSMILPAISLRKHFLSSWIWAAVLLHYELESSKSLVPLAQSELYIKLNQMLKKLRTTHISFSQDHPYPIRPE